MKKSVALDAMLNAHKIALGPILFQAARLLRDLGILKALRQSRNGLTIDEIVENVDASAYGVHVLLEAGLAAGVVNLEDDRYLLAPTGVYLLDDTAARINMDFVQQCCFQSAYYLEDSIRDGKPIGLQRVFADTDSIYPALPEFPDSARDSWLEWDHHYSDSAFSQALPIVLEHEPSSILDVGGNTGKWAVQCAKHSERVEITILDHPQVIELAEKNIRLHGLQDRISTLGRDLLNDSAPLPNDFDAIWMSQFLVCFSEDQIARLLERTVDAMDSRSRLFVLDNFWDRQSNDVSRFCLQTFSLYFTFLANGCSRMYRATDIVSMIEDAGMKVERIVDNLGVCSSLLICSRN